MGDLRERRFKSLADTLDSGPDFKPSVRRDPGKDLFVERAPLTVGGCAVSGLFREYRDAEADQPAIRFAALLPRPDRRKIDGVDCPAQDLRVVAAVEVLVGDVVKRHL